MWLHNSRGHSESSHKLSGSNGLPHPEWLLHRWWRWWGPAGAASPPLSSSSSASTCRRQGRCVAGWPVPFCMPSVCDVCFVTLLPKASGAVQHPLQPMLPIPRLPALGCSEALLTSMLPHGASVQRLELGHSLGRGKNASCSCQLPRHGMPGSSVCSHHKCLLCCRCA